eukprot:g36523.t1
MFEVKSSTAESSSSSVASSAPMVKLHGRWYDLTTFLHQHPGGSRILSSSHGLDRTRAFEKYMHSERARAMLARFETDESEVKSATGGEKAAFCEVDDLDSVSSVACPSLLHYAAEVLRTHSSSAKAYLTLKAWESWQAAPDRFPVFLAREGQSEEEGGTSEVDPQQIPQAPAQPARDRQLQTLARDRMQGGVWNLQKTQASATTGPADETEHTANSQPAPRKVGKKGKEGKSGRGASKVGSKSEAKEAHRQVMLDKQKILVHGQAHIESYAIDLSWDMILRFALRKTRESQYVWMPRAFFADWLKVAADEAKHFLIWRNRLYDLHSCYGAFPVHDGLWESASETKHSLSARLAVVHMVHEARGLDTAPRLKQKFRGGGDQKSADFLDEIEQDELTHVACGMKWFLYCCQLEGVEPVPTFHALVRKHFQGFLLPPFNTTARESVGLSEDCNLKVMIQLSLWQDLWVPRVPEYLSKILSSAVVSYPGPTRQAKLSRQPGSVHVHRQSLIIVAGTVAALSK